MGLDTSHGCWNGPYSLFNSFRIQVAAQIGFDLDKMEGFGGEISFDDMNHPIKPLLDHSDCDGQLSSSDLTSIVKGIDMILKDFDDSKIILNDERFGDTSVKDIRDFVIRRLKIFKEGAEDALSLNENVIFM